jgi:hypothetical protein
VKLDPGGAEECPGEGIFHRAIEGGGAHFDVRQGGHHNVDQLRHLGHCRLCTAGSFQNGNHDLADRGPSYLIGITRQLFKHSN